jgi:RNA polymerase sigma factor FliA
MDSKVDTNSLWESFLANRSPEVREQLILSNVSLVHYILGRLGISQDATGSYQEMVNQGLLGLIEAVDHYNPTLGTKFSTYATLRIRGKIIDFMRCQDWLSRGARRRVRNVQGAINTLWEKNHQEPSTEEISSLLKIDPSEVEQGLLDSSHVLMSLDMTVDYESEESFSLHDVLPDEKQENPSDTIQETELKAELVSVIQNLPQREQLILSLYYYEELTLKQIGHVMGITESRACQLHARAILNLKAMLNHVENFTSAA